MAQDKKFTPPKQQAPKETDKSEAVSSLEETGVLEYGPTNCPEEFSDRMDEALAEIQSCVSKQVLLERSRYWATQFMKDAGPPALFKLLDYAVQKRMAGIRTLTKDTKRPTKVENGHYLAPTPSLGTRVYWYQNDEDSRIIPGDVVAIEGVGRIQIKLLKAKNDASSVPDHILGVFHRGNPMHKRGNPSTMRSGSWDYMVTTGPPSCDYEPARVEVATKMQRAQEAKENQLAIERAVQEQERLAMSSEPTPV